MTEADPKRVLLVGSDGLVQTVERALVHRFETADIVHETGMYDALSVLADSHVDCIVSEYELPDGDGLAFVRRVREDEPNCPFVLFPACGSEELASEAIAAGVTDYVPQETDTPNIEMLVDSVATACDAGGERGEYGRTLFEEAPDPVFVVDTDGQIVDVSESVVDSHGYEPGALVGRYIWEVEVTIDREAFLELLGRATAEGSVFMDGRHRRADGTEFPVEAHIGEVEHDGETRFIATVRDVTQQDSEQDRSLDTERTLTELYEVLGAETGPSETTLETVLELGCERLDLPYGYFTRVDTDYQHVEATAGDHGRFEPGDTIPLTESYCRDTVQTDGIEAIADTSVAGWEGDQAHERLEFGCYLGKKVVVNGELYGTLCFAGDRARERGFSETDRTFVEFLVTWLSHQLRRREYEADLERARDRFERTQEIAGVGAWELDIESGTVTWTTETCRIHDVPVTFEPTLDEAVEFFHSEDRERISDAVERAIHEGEPYDIEARVVTARGETRWVRTNGRPRFEDGDPVVLRGTIQDITERREREQELQESKEALDQISRSIDDVVWVNVPGQEEIMFVSDAYEDIWGRSVSSLYENPQSFVEAIHRDDRDRVEAALERQNEAPESYDETYRVVQPDGTVRWVRDRSFGVYDDDGELERIVGIASDITQQRARERELERYEAIVEAMDDGAFVVGEDWTIEYANTTAVSYIDASRTAIETVPILELAREFGVGGTAPDRLETALSQVFDESRDEYPVTAEFELALPTESIVAECHCSPLESDGERKAVLTVRDISERKAHAETLTGLHDVTRELLQAETDTEIAELTVDAAADLFDADGLGVFLFDEDENRLVPGAVAETRTNLVGEPPTFGPGDSIAWDVFVAGEGRVYENVRDAENVHNPETPFRTEVFLPLGDRGVLIAGMTEEVEISERRIELVEILAANCEEALKRAEREHKLRERDRTLRQQNTRLEQLREINDEIRRIDQALISAETREEIEETVCRRLADIDRFEFAWIAEHDAVDDRVVPRSWDGAEGNYIDAIDTRLEADEPTARALREGASVTVGAVAEDLRAEPWRSDALSRDFLSALSVPLVYDGITYGVLSVYADQPSGFNEMSQSVIEELAATVAHAITAVERKEALLSDTRAELEFTVETVTTPLFGIVADLDCHLTLDSVLPRPDGTTLLYVTVSDAPEQAMVAAGSDRVSVESVRHVGATTDGQKFEVGVTGETLATTVADLGGRLEELRIDGAAGRIVLSLPEQADVRSFVDQFTEQVPGAELYARRRRNFEIDRPTERGLFEELTPRQAEVLEAAYHSGFFEWPRRSTGEEIADSLDVAPPTFLEHLRRAEAKLVDRLIDDGTRQNPADD